MAGRPNVFRLLQLAIVALAFTLPGFFIAGVLTRFIKGQVLERSVGIRVGMAKPVVQARMASLGFDCAPDRGEEHLTVTDMPQEEVLCRKMQRIGFGMTNRNSRFIMAIVPPEWIYTLFQKDELSSTYIVSDIVFGLNREAVSYIRPSFLLR
jgi:hypothetical protein